jgi:hypothetical protein
MHVEDLIQVERELGYRYESTDPGVEHYQWICPRCRRALLALAQNRIRFPALSNGNRVSLPATMPEPANAGTGEGPLGSEDRENFHP